MMGFSAVADDPSAPTAAAERPIDLVHLARMTLGDRSLEREVLQLFDRQSLMLMDRMRHVEATAVPALAHTLKGSAVGIGARRVARAAECVESARSEADMRSAVASLSAATDEARKVIGELLRAN